MGVSWDTPVSRGDGPDAARRGDLYGQVPNDRAGSVHISAPTSSSGVDAGGHGGSHGYLMCEFVEAILLDRTPLIDVAQALNMTVSGIVAHESALKDGELLKIPQYTL